MPSRTHLLKQCFMCPMLASNSLCSQLRQLPVIYSFPWCACYCVCLGASDIFPASPPFGCYFTKRKNRGTERGELNPPIIAQINIRDDTKAGLLMSSQLWKLHPMESGAGEDRPMKPSGGRGLWQGALSRGPTAH